MNWQQQKFAMYYIKYAWILSSGVIKLKMVSIHCVVFYLYESLCQLWPPEKTKKQSLFHVIYTIIQTWAYFPKDKGEIITLSPTEWTWCCSSPVTCGLNLTRIWEHPVACRAAPYGNNGKVFHIQQHRTDIYVCQPVTPFQPFTPLPAPTTTKIFPLPQKCPLSL